MTLVAIIIVAALMVFFWRVTLALFAVALVVLLIMGLSEVHQLTASQSFWI